MKPDFYTKAVLTVIASCLVYFVVQDITPIKEAHAQSGRRGRCEYRQDRWLAGEVFFDGTAGQDRQVGLAQIVMRLALPVKPLCSHRRRV